MRITLKHSGAKRPKPIDDDDSNSPSSPRPSQTPYEPRQLQFKLRPTHNNPPPPSQTPYKPRQLQFKLRPAHNPPPPSRPPGPVNQAQRPNVNLPKEVQKDPAQRPNDGVQTAAELSVGEINQAINNPEEFDKLVKEQQLLLAGYNQQKQEPALSVSQFNVAELQQHLVNHFMGLLQQPQQNIGPAPLPKLAKSKVRPRWTGLGPFVPRGQPMGPPPSIRAMSSSERAGRSIRVEPERALVSPPLMAESEGSEKSIQVKPGWGPISPPLPARPKGAGPSTQVEPERVPISPPLMTGSSSKVSAGPVPVSSTGPIPASGVTPIKKRPIRSLFQDFESERNG